MTFVGWMELVKLVLKFPEQLLEVARYFSKTEQQQHDAMLKKLREEQKKFEETGRPVWY